MSDEPRHVYADLLAERGRPHGSSSRCVWRTRVARSSARIRACPAPSPRRTRVSSSTGSTPAITLVNLRFERGFVAHCELSDKVSERR